VINLRTVAKQKQRAARAQTATAAAAKHGRSKAQKAAGRATTEAQARHLDAHKRDDS